MNDFGLGYIPMGREKMIKVTNLIFAGKFHRGSVGIENLLSLLSFLLLALWLLITLTNKIITHRESLYL
jgi:hypothetical protein